VPVLLEIGRESVRSGLDEDALLAEAETLAAEAMGEAEPPAFRQRAMVPPKRPMRVRQAQGSLFSS